MKKFALLLVAVFFTAISSSVFAQGTGTAPSIGSTHQYWVNGDFGSPSTAGASSNYTWWISIDENNLLTPTTNTSHFSVTGGAAYNTATVGTSGGNGIQLVWNPVSAGGTYYLVVKENDGTCDNIKAVAIQPVNNFEIVFAALDESEDAKDNPERCAPDIAVTATGTTISYNYGSDEYIYKISSTGLYSDWTFNYAFTNTLGAATPVIAYSTDGSAYSPVSTSGTGVSVDPDTNGQKTVYFKVTLTNGTEEGLDGQSMALTLTNISDGNNPPAKIYKSNGTDEFGVGVDVKQTQTVKARPATTSISFN